MAWVVKELVYKVLHPINNVLNLKSRTLTPSTAGTAQVFTLVTPPKGHVLLIDKLYIYNPSSTNTATVAIVDGNNIVAGPFKVAPGETIELSMNDVGPIMFGLAVQTDYEVQVSGTIMVI